MVYLKLIYIPTLKQNCCLFLHIDVDVKCSLVNNKKKNALVMALHIEICLHTKKKQKQKKLSK